VRFTTYERVQSTALLVSKRDNRREEFNREKLVNGIRKACAKRPIPSKTIEKMVEDIETELQHLGQGEVPSDIIGRMVMERLINVDRVAYIRYASVYRDFQDIESFERVVKDLREDNTQLSLPQMGMGPTRRRRQPSSRPKNRIEPEAPDHKGHTEQSNQAPIFEGDILDHE
jgi:transcriptional repressor NrdR